MPKTSRRAVITARVLSRYVDAIMIRMLDHAAVRELAAHATVPVINGLTKLSHPCQVMADVFTFEERRGPIAGRTVAWSGDANNVLASWVHAAARFGFAINAATPGALAPDPALIDWARANNVAFNVTRDPREAVKGADVVVTDCWVSMGDKDEDFRRQTLAPYQVNTALMGEAAKDAIFMHCLPAHRGEEVTADVFESAASVVFDQAENRLHVQKALLSMLLSGPHA